MGRFVKILFIVVFIAVLTLAYLPACKGRGGDSAGNTSGVDFSVKNESTWK